MVRKEEISKQALKYGEPEYLLQTPNILGTQGFIQGAIWADKTMIEKACEWLDKNITNYKSDMMGYIEYSQISDIIQDFRKAMEE